MAASSSGTVSAQQAEDDQAWAEAWEEMEEELELEQEAAPAYLLLLPQEILDRVLGLLSHSTLVNAVFRVNVRLSRASAAESRTRTQSRLLDALIAGFGDAAEATRPRLSSLATQLEKALASAGSARYQSKFRQLVFNLKDPKNPDLRARLLSGDIGTVDLLRLSAQQVAHRRPSTHGRSLCSTPSPSPYSRPHKPHASVRVGSWPAASCSSSARSGDARASCAPRGRMRQVESAVLAAAQLATPASWGQHSWLWVALRNPEERPRRSAQREGERLRYGQQPRPKLRTLIRSTTGLRAAAATRLTYTAATTAAGNPLGCIARSAPEEHTSIAPRRGPLAPTAGSAGRCSCVLCAAYKKAYQRGLC